MTCIACLLAAAMGQRQIGERGGGVPRYRDNIGAFRRYIQPRIYRPPSGSSSGNSSHIQTLFSPTWKRPDAFTRVFNRSKGLPDHVE